jgi:predicted RNA binding protein YcfA (HicA-like mRNA interferase family)
MPVKVLDVIRLLERPLIVTVPGNDGKELAPGTLNAILKKAGLK